MTASVYPAGAAEFPNDNPALHDGARWVCPDTIGPARALLRPRPSGGAIPVIAAELAAPRPREAQRPPERRYEGPLQLDLGRIVLVHRVEDIPPPPDFIFQPFVSSCRKAAEGAEPAMCEPSPNPASSIPPSSSAASSSAEFDAWELPDELEPVEAPRELAVAVLTPLDPRPCRAVDELQAGRRVQRGSGVDVAPCVNVGDGAEGSRARPRLRGIVSVRVLPASTPASTVPPELEAASA